MVIAFTHTITESEWRTKYLNLKDDQGTGYWEQFPPHGTRLIVIDNAERQSSATKHHDRQIWGNLRSWYEKNQVRPGTLIKIQFDPAEKAQNGEPILRLLVQQLPERPLQAAEEEGEIEKTIEVPLSFEKQLEDFLEVNSHLIEPELKLFVDESGNRGRQYPTDVGTIDLLYVRPNGDLVVAELKQARGSDEVVGQISRYLGWVRRHIAGDKGVHGVIITHEYDPKLKYAVEGNKDLILRYYRIRLEFVDEEQVTEQE